LTNNTRTTHNSTISYTTKNCRTYYYPASNYAVNNGYTTYYYYPADNYIADGYMTYDELVDNSSYEYHTHSLSVEDIEEYYNWLKSMAMQVYNPNEPDGYASDILEMVIDKLEESFPVLSKRLLLEPP
jgi:hypothetical protein